MKYVAAILAVGVGVISSLTPLSAQPYDRYSDRYRERHHDSRGYRGFSERDYLRCHRDVRAAVRRGQFESGYEHYRKHGRREGRQVFC